MHVRGAGASCRGATALFGVAVTLYSGNQTEKIIPIARTERRLVDNVALNHRSRGGILGGQQWRRRFYIDRFAGRANLQRKVLARLLADLQRDLTYGLPKAIF